MIILRWTTGVALGCAAFAALFLPFPPSTAPSWQSPAPAPLVAEIAKLTQAAGEAQHAVREYRQTQALERWAAASTRNETTLVGIDRSVPEATSSVVRAIVSEQWAALGVPVSAAHAEVFVYFDSTSIPRPDAAAGSHRSVEPRRLVDIAFALPPATDGKRCVTLVRMRGLSPAHIGALRSQSLTGPCGFYAAFGLPGSQVRTWLAADRYRFARQSDWSVARAPATDVSLLYALSEESGRCVTGDVSSCRAALRFTRARDSLGPAPDHKLAWVIDPAVSAASLSGRTPPSLGDAEGQLLADAVRSIGAERFGRFWRSAGDPSSAFLEASGEGIDTWTQQWMTRTYGAAPERPTVHTRDIAWLVVALPLALLIAVRRRERVLAERLPLHRLLVRGAA